MAVPRPRPKPVLPPTQTQPKLRGRRAGRPAPAWPLLVVDEAPLRREAARVYQEAAARVGKLREQVERFTSRDQPGYARWLGGRFQTLLARFQAAALRLQERSTLLDLVRMMVFLGGVPPAAAYREACRQMAGGDAAASDPAEDGDGFPFNGFFQAKPGSPDGAERGGQRSERPGRSGGSTRAGRAADADPAADAPFPDDEPSAAGAGSRPRRPPSARRQTADQRLKEIYRKLVRSLHPDANPGLGEAERELWHEAQEAYGRGDLARLEAVWAARELGRHGELAVNASVGGLHELARELGRSARRLQNELNRHRKDPAWGFTGRSPAENDTLAVRIETELRESVEELDYDLAAIETELDAFRAAPRGGGRSGSRRQPATRRAPPAKKPARKPPRAGRRPPFGD